MTLEREKESEKLKDECKKLQAEYANSEVSSVCLNVIVVNLFSVYHWVKPHLKFFQVIYQNSIWLSFALSDICIGSVQSERQYLPLLYKARHLEKNV